MIYVNYNAYLVRTDPETSKLKIKQATDPNELIQVMQDSVADHYSPVTHWN